jgi:HD-GYP domain-containing protein (c-di-GMP phosphodiesterase class II)
MAKQTGLEFIKEETRKRCRIIQVDARSVRKFSTVSTELFHLIYDAKSVGFALYFRIDNTMIEFIKPEEFSKELLDQMWAALHASGRKLEVSVLQKDRDQLESLITKLRAERIDRLVLKDPALDRRTLDVFSNLSSASQLVVRGGINGDVAKRVQQSATYMVNNLMDSDMAIATLSRMITHDPTLYDHSASVAMIAGMICNQCLPKPLSPKETILVSQCGLYHDVGKTCVPSAILNKPGRFTDEEFEIMKTHAHLGELELLEVIDTGAPIDPIAARVAGEHHERFGGHGYPKGRKGRHEDDHENGIHLYTRIVSIADVYSALLMKRVYKPAYEPQDAIKIMAETARKEYDPDIFVQFIKTVVNSLNTYQEKNFGKDKGRLLDFDEEGNLRERRREVI